MPVQDYPFDITPELMAEFDREQEASIVHNHPIRDVEREDFWDFMNWKPQNSLLTPKLMLSLYSGLFRRIY